MILTILAACVQKGAETCAQPASVSQDHFTVIVGAIVAGFGSLMTFMGILLNRQRQTDKKVASAQFAVTNGHEEHIRDDLDRKFRELERKIDGKFERVFGALGFVSGKLNTIENTQEGGHRAYSQDPE